MFEQLNTLLQKIKINKPLILCLTNHVTMDFMANALLALGSAPIMSESDTELHELITAANAISINIGTLDTSFIQRMDTAITAIKQENKPLVLDPVGAGATKLRTELARHLLPHAHIIRGNASEIMALTENNSSYGVESLHEPTAVAHLAQQLSLKNNIVLAITGATDMIIAANQIQSLSFGSPMMKYVTGMGCVLSSLIAAFHALEKNAFHAATLATSFACLCGELAMKKAPNPGSFKTAFIDYLYAPDMAFIQERLTHAR